MKSFHAMFHTKALWHTYNKNVVHAVVHPSDAPSVCTAVASCWGSLSSTSSDDCGHRILDRLLPNLRVWFPALEAYVACDSLVTLLVTDAGTYVSFRFSPSTSPEHGGTAGVPDPDALYSQAIFQPTARAIAQPAHQGQHLPAPKSTTVAGHESPVPPTAHPSGPTPLPPTFPVPPSDALTVELDTIDLEALAELSDEQRFGSMEGDLQLHDLGGVLAQGMGPGAELESRPRSARTA